MSPLKKKKIKLPKVLRWLLDHIYVKWGKKKVEGGVKWKF